MDPPVCASSEADLDYVVSVLFGSGYTTVELMGAALFSEQELGDWMDELGLDQKTCFPNLRILQLFGIVKKCHLTNTKAPLMKIASNFRAPESCSCVGKAWLQ